MGIGYTNTIETQRFSNEIPLAPIPDVRFARSVENGGISAFFQDPKDIYVDGQLITKREETIIVAKKGASPENHLDGEYVYTHTGYHDVQKWLEFIPSYSDYDGAGAQLYVQFFAISATGNIYPITRVYKLYTYLYAVRIDSDDPNPDTRVTPSFGNAITAPHPATPADWELVEPFKSIRPCLFKNGKVQYYLSKGNFMLKEDGSLSDIESGVDGDVMIEFPNVNVIVLEGGVVISGIPFPPNEDSVLSPLEGFDSLDNFYVSAYLGCEKEGELRSLAGYGVAKKYLSEVKALLEPKGQRYDLFPFWTLNIIQALFILKYKTTNSEAIGFGKLGDLYTIPLTGTTRNAPMDSGTTEDASQNVKLFGIEGLWGMEESWVSGIKPESNNSLRVDTNRDGSSFKTINYGGAGYGGYMKKPLGGLLGFIPHTPMWGGSDSTYFCDYFSIWGSGSTSVEKWYFLAPGRFLSHTNKRSDGLFSSGFSSGLVLRAIRFVYY